MEKLSFALGLLIKTAFDIELAALLLRAIIEMLVKKESIINRFLFFATEPIILPARAFFSKTKLFSKSAIDVAFCASFFVLSALDLVFGIWFKL